MRSNWLVLSIILGITSILADDLRLVDLPPEEAQQHIDGKDQTLKYAPKIDSNVPAVRVLGKTPTNVLEDIYLANQYHGQDGLGGYLYGYSVPDIAKTEKKQAQGDLRGEYQYINGDGKEIKVQYWDDGTGFHQTDNLPEVLPKQVEDSPEVQAAKEEFFKRWHEEAERNSHPESAVGSPPAPPQYQPSYGPQSGQPFPGPQREQANYGASSNQGGVYQPNQSNQPQLGHYGASQNQGQGGYSPQGNPQNIQSAQSSQYRGVQVQEHGGFSPQINPGLSSQSHQVEQDQSSSSGGYQYGPPPSNQANFHPGQNAPSPSAYQQRDEYSAQYSSNQPAYENAQNGNEWEYKPTEEEKGPPRGFFYNFDYPVGIIVQKQGEAGNVHKRELLGLYSDNKANFEDQLKRGASTDGSSQIGYQVHA